MRAGLLLATALPAVLYVGSLSAYGHWLDSGEFVAVATDLGISHPPGHPLASLAFGLARLIPFGPLALRVAFLSSVASCLAAFFFFRALNGTLVALGVSKDYVSVPIAVGATWAFAGAHAVWLQAVRPEVYALESLLTLIVIERLVELETVQPSRDTRALGSLGLAFGLGLANHHLLGFLVLPAAMPTLARIVERKGLASLRTAAIGVALGLVPYLLLPIRAIRDPMLALGDPSSPSRFAWVVSARAFQSNQGTHIAQPLDDRFADVGDLLLSELSPVGLVAAFAAAVVLLRASAYRRFAMIWGAVFVSYLVARAWLGFVRENPDALGYLIPAIAAAVALAASAFGLLVQRFVEKGSFRARAALAAILVATLGLAQIDRSTEKSSLARFADTDAFDDALRRDLPPRAVVFAFFPATYFRYVGGEAEEHVRPDVTIVPIPFLSYPSAIDRLAAAHPELAPVLRAYALEGRLSLPELQTLANDRPVLIELDPMVGPEIREALAPSGVYFELLPGGTTDGDEAEGRRSARAAYRRIARLIDPIVDPETAAQVVWRQYQGAVYYAGFGDLASARACLDVARRFAPRDVTIAEATDLLANTTETRVDLQSILEQRRQGTR